MSDSAEEMPTRPVLPEDHVLHSGAVIYPGAFDQHGCPLVVFPAEFQDKLVSELTKEEVADFISYFLRLHSNSKDGGSVSVVADLREASLSVSRRVAESLLLLELHRRTVHSVYMVQPRKRDVLKLLQKLLLPGKTKHTQHTAFKCVFLKEMCELWNYIDRSQLTTSLGGYLLYCHSSWVSFVKEIDSFVQEFVAVVQRLPVCISALQSVSTLPVPADVDTLTHFCSSNQAQLQQIRSDLGLDELLRRCQCVLEKFRRPESDPCYQAMVGTQLYTHTALEMLHNYERITAAVEKVELLWQQAFSKARVQLQVLNLQREAEQIMTQMEGVQKKLESFRTEMLTDARGAEALKLEFEASVHTHAMALVRRAEDVVHTLVETVGEHGLGEQWVEELQQQCDQFRSAVEHQYSNIRTHCTYYQCYNKIQSWYSRAVCESFLQDLLWVTCCNGQSDVSVRREWKPALESFLRVHTCPQVEELVQLSHLANVIPDPQLQSAGKQLAHRCMTLRKLLTCPGSATLRDLQLALQWQYEHLKGSHETVTSDLPPGRSEAAETADGQCSDQRDSGSFTPFLRPSPSQSGLNKQDCAKDLLIFGSVTTPPVGKAPSLSSFDSGFEGAGSGQVYPGKEGPEALPRMPCSRNNASRPRVPQLHISEENVSTVSDCEELDHGIVGVRSSRASIHIIPRVTADSLNFEIKVQRSATLPKNPWLSLPVEDLENSYTVTITPSSPGLQRAQKSSDNCRDQPTQTDTLGIGQRQEHDGSFREVEFSPIRNVLSSTMTEGGDHANSTADAPPTLLWDTYDLHDVGDATCEGLSDVSLGNWELEEQKELHAVEEILGRTAEILQQEEDVLAQEEDLDVLLKADHPDRQWPSWNHGAQLAQMSSSDLAEAGVIGLDDDPSSSLHLHHDLLPSGPGLEALSPTDQLLNPNRSSDRVLQELKDLEVLEGRIMEEKLKIQELRLSDTTPEKRRKFLEELEREKKEVEEMERSLTRDKKRREGKMKKLPKAQKVVKCSIMEMASALRSLEDEDDQALVMKCRRQLQDRISCKPTCSTTDELKNSKPASGTGESITPVIHLGKASASRSFNSTADGLVHCTESLKPPDLSTEEPTCSNLPTSKELYQQSLDSHHKDSSSPSPTVKNGTLKLGLGHHQENMVVASSPEPDGDVLAPGVLLAVDLEKNERPDSYSTVSDLSNTHATSVGDLEQPQDPGENLLGASKLDINKKMLVANEGLCIKDVEAPETCLENGLASLEAGQERAQFDPGGPKPLPRVTQPRKPSTLDQTGSISLVPPTGSPQPKKRKNPPQKINQDAAQHNRNNNNPRCEYGSEAVLEEAVEESKCEVDQSEVCMSLIPETESPAVCENSVDNEVMNTRDDEGPLTRTICRSPVHQEQLQICTREMSDFKTPVVLDTGSGMVKAGFADQDLPSVIFPTAVGLPKYEEVMSGSAERDVYVGHDAQHMRGVLTLHYPMKNGVISNWDQIEMIWQHVFQQLCVDAEDHPVLLTEAVMNPHVSRQRMVQLMFESFNVPLTFIALQPVLALYAAGRTTGVVLDSGDGVSHSVPVFDGYSLPHAVQRFALAGADVTLQLKNLLLEQGVCMRTSAELEIVREIKERCCSVALDYEAELNRRGEAIKQAHYTLPDGQVVSLTTERFRAPEILFRPELIGRDHYGMHESIFKSVLQSDIDLRRSLLGNIVLSGGNTLLAGLPERLRVELARLAPPGVCDGVRVISPPGRDFSVWKGGAVLSGLQAFGSAWIGRDEYDEFGPGIVHRKCF